MGLRIDLPTRLVFGDGEIDRLGEYARELGATRAFLVTDAGIVAAGHASRAIDSLHKSGLTTCCFAGVQANPTTRDVDAGLLALGDFAADLFIGLGGGSSLDVAKGCNFLHAGGGQMEDYWGVGKAKGTLVPMIAVPTTAGTGSETQSFALIGQAGTRQKMACGDPQAAAKIALLDPGLTVTLPADITAITGLDTIAHAVEAAVATKRTAVAMLFATAAFALAHRQLPRVLEAPGDLLARGHMLRAAAYGGIAVENSMLGAAHALANPLTARFGIAHGQAVGLMLPHVVRCNAGEPAVAAVYAEFARMSQLCSNSTTDGEAVAVLLQRLDELLAASGVTRQLSELGVPAAAYQALAEEAAQQWTAQFNPRPLSVGDFQELLGMAS